VSLRVLPYGADAALVDLGCDEAPDRADRTLALATRLRARHPDADVVIGAGTIAVVGVTAEALGDLAVSEEHAIALGPAQAAGRLHVLGAVYDGPDLGEVAAALGVSTHEVVARHAAPTYAVELLGFLPGFAYLEAPSFAVRVPRRSTPRPRVPAGSVGVAAGFTGVYPFTSPGGWNLLARVVSAVPFDPRREPPVLFAPGDRVRFEPVEASDLGPPVAPGVEARRGPEPPARGLLVVAAPACATVQDEGRRGQLARGIPPSGPLDRDTHRAANAAVGNPGSAATVEVPLGSLEIEARGAPAWVSVDGEPAVRIGAGERLRVVEGARPVRYLAVAGGFDVPVVMGARATLLAAGVGGHLGRPLRRGDVLALGDEAGAGASRAAVAGLSRDDDAILVDPGPHVDRFPEGAFEALLGARFRVSRHGDRVGVRLEGARLLRDGPDVALPVPMIRGAVEITTDGTPIVLGPDHPTTGGYPVLAVVRGSSLAELARRRPGAEVRFAAGAARGDEVTRRPS
jgi:KipI family sensor histidine kinase inhibitor